MKGAWATAPWRWCHTCRVWRAWHLTRHTGTRIECAACTPPRETNDR